MAIKYSDEQLEIIHEPYHPGTRKTVVAYSGCGKSTTLVGVANTLRKDLSILYLSFNSSVAKEAAKKFPKHVKCTTFHSLAYNPYAHPYVKRLGSPKSSEFTERMSTIVKGGQAVIALAFYSLSTFEKWCNSADPAPTSKHIPSDALISIEFGLISATNIVDGVIAIFDEMMHGDCVVSHSLYLKLFQLNNPVLPFDCIMVDEAQDLNPVVVDVLDKQECEIILVGDPHQSIYGFRDTVNALDVPNAKQFSLTTTYRFGQNLADLATKILVKHKGAEHPLVGKGAPVFIDEYDNNDPELDELRKSPLFIHRTKAGIIETLISIFEIAESKPDDPCQIFFPGTIRNYGFDEIMDTYRFYKTGEGSGQMAQYRNWDQFKETQLLINDQNTLGTIAIIERYKGMVARTIALANKHKTTKAKNATASITTAHKSKGLEHPYVIIGSDFPDLTDITKPSLSIQEVNLGYVALTRAERAINTSINLRKLINSDELRRVSVS
jgi:F-box protein 18 (helicase)